jgi:HEAT repeat protein
MHQVERLSLWLFTEAPEAPRYVFNDRDVMLCCNDDTLLPEVLQPSRLISQWSPEGGALHFIHTTFQEHLAARSLLCAPEDEFIRHVRKHALDGAWWEIIRFVAADEGKIPDSFWAEMRRIAGNPDRFGILLVRLASLMAEAGERDGGEGLLGIDLRDELWNKICEGLEVNVFVEAYAELDARGYVQRIKEFDAHGDVQLQDRLLRSLRRIRSPESSKAMVERILSGDRRSVAVIGFAISEVLTGEGRKALRDALADPGLDADVRASTMDALGMARDYQSAGRLVEIALSDEALSDRAIKSLGFIGGRVAGAALVRLLPQTRDMEKSRRILSALRNIRETEARNGLLQELAVCAPDDPLLPAILEALHEKPISRHSELIIEFLDHPDPEVRGVASGALADATESGATEALAGVARNDESEVARIAALEALKYNARPSDISWLAERVKDEGREEEERAEALEAVMLAAARCRHRDGPWMESLAASLALEALNRPDLVDLAFSAAALGYLMGNDLAPRLAEIIGSEQWPLSIREAACVSLGKLRYSDAVGALLELVRREPEAPNDEEMPETDQGKRVARAAAEAIAQIDPTLLIHEPGRTARNALGKLSMSRGCLVFSDHVLDVNGQVVRSRARP